jgi:hypothetical protein
LGVLALDVAAPSATVNPPAPDWVSSRDLHCPLCEYNLRGLTEPRCPECGYRFQWAELIDEKLKLHPYLFEHHPRRNVRSFWKTAVGGLQPGRFWTKLHAGQPSLCLPVLWGVVTYRLGRAYRDYLKFGHPWATVIAAQIIVGLTVLVMAVNVMVTGMR